MYAVEVSLELISRVPDTVVAAVFSKRQGSDPRILAALGRGRD